mmetsp:Transcript_93886/g.223335  ORF Transcript_93886/g.223335 Transcript_93886/m.223335 type:complete len:200 (+) Transcript_93886:185-784(+)
MQLPNDADPHALADDVGLHAREEGGVLAGLQVEAPALGALLMLMGGLAAQGIHQLVQGAVQQGELTPHVAVHSHQPPHVLAAYLFGRLLHHHVPHLEEADGRRQLLVVGQGLQDPRDQRGPHDLEADGLGIGHRDRWRGGAVLIRRVHRAAQHLSLGLAPQKGVVLLLGQKRPIHALGEASHCQLGPHQVGEIVHWLAS